MMKAITWFSIPALILILALYCLQPYIPEVGDAGPTKITLRTTDFNCVLNPLLSPPGTNVVYVKSKVGYHGNYDKN